jgi:2-polyprenyl-6-hydroxyphenyl methylase/3-demethylubiquinone-9 3-methyltransferase
LFISTINRTPLAYALGIVAAENILKLVPQGTHTFEKFIQPEELSGALAKISGKATLENGTERTWRWYMHDSQGMMYDPLCQKWRWEDKCWPLAMQMNYIAVAKRANV